MGDQRINQAELARKTKIRPATINEYYHELVERVNLDYISRICEALDCEVGDILEYIPTERSKTKNPKVSHLN
jgi:putative transcriptional regulator